MRDSFALHSFALPLPEGAGPARPGGADEGGEGPAIAGVGIDAGVEVGGDEGGTGATGGNQWQARNFMRILPDFITGLARNFMRILPDFITGLHHRTMRILPDFITALHNADRAGSLW